MNNTIVICQECSTRNPSTSILCDHCGNGLKKIEGCYPDLKEMICRFCLKDTSLFRGWHICAECREEIPRKIFPPPDKWKDDKNANIMGIFLSQNLSLPAKRLRNLMLETHGDFPITEAQYIFFIDTIKARSEYDES